jgi:N-acetylglutamate synthase-like GNAT family acetyltransferase
VSAAGRSEAGPREAGRSARGVILGPLADLAAMRRLGVACGLEDEGRDDEGILAAWGAFAGSRLVGAICLERQSDLDTVNWMSVDEEYRSRGIAAALYAELEREALGRGMRRLWVTARAPGFFLAQGFEPVSGGAERDTLLGGCLTCAQFAGTCRPEALTKTLQATGGARRP